MLMWPPIDVPPIDVEARSLAHLAPDKGAALGAVGSGPSAPAGSGPLDGRRF